jgi:hypothetical protein
MVKVVESQKEQIIELWNAGKSVPEIVNELDLPISGRQVKRIGAASGDRAKRWKARVEKYGNRSGL